jgi:trans-aconitate 2-methyltransferase
MAGGGGISASKEWDAHTYDRIADPMARWGAAVLERLRLEGDELVLDAGCGSGRVTELLLARLPRGHVIALDASQAMLDEAAQRLRGDARVELVRADLVDPLPIQGPVDAVLSTATFHWVMDHDRLFANLAAVMRAGAQLVAQCGGAGNVSRVGGALRAMGYDWSDTKNFSTPEQTEARLRGAGFTNIEAWLEPQPTRFQAGAPFEEYLRTIVLRDYVRRQPEDARDAFVHEVAVRVGEPELDYVRLNIVATRAETSA